MPVASRKDWGLDAFVTIAGRNCPRDALLLLQPPRPFKVVRRATRGPARRAGRRGGRTTEWSEGVSLRACSPPVLRCSSTLLLLSHCSSTTRRPPPGRPGPNRSGLPQRDAGRAPRRHRRRTGQYRQRPGRHRQRAGCVNPVRDDTATTTCPVCGLAFEPTGRQRHSTRCRQLLSTPDASALGLPGPVPSVSQRDVRMVSTTTESGLDGNSHDLGITRITIRDRHLSLAGVWASWMQLMGCSGCAEDAFSVVCPGRS